MNSVLHIREFMKSRAHYNSRGDCFNPVFLISGRTNRFNTLSIFDRGAFELPSHELSHEIDGKRLVARLRKRGITFHLCSSGFGSTQELAR